MFINLIIAILTVLILFPSFSCKPKKNKDSKTESFNQRDRLGRASLDKIYFGYEKYKPFDDEGVTLEGVDISLDLSTFNKRDPSLDTDDPQPSTEVLNATSLPTQISYSQGPLLFDLDSSIPQSSEPIVPHFFPIQESTILSVIGCFGEEKVQNSCITTTSDSVTQDSLEFSNLAALNKKVKIPKIEGGNLVFTEVLVSRRRHDNNCVADSGSSDSWQTGTSRQYDGILANTRSYNTDFNIVPFEEGLRSDGSANAPRCVKLYSGTNILTNFTGELDDLAEETAVSDSDKFWFTLSAGTCMFGVGSKLVPWIKSATSGTAVAAKASKIGDTVKKWPLFNRFFLPAENLAGATAGTAGRVKGVLNSILGPVGNFYSTLYSKMRLAEGLDKLNKLNFLGAGTLKNILGSVKSYVDTNGGSAAAKAIGAGIIGAISKSKMAGPILTKLGIRGSRAVAVAGQEGDALLSWTPELEESLNEMLDKKLTDSMAEFGVNPDDEMVQLIADTLDNPEIQKQANLLVRKIFPHGIPGWINAELAFDGLVALGSLAFPALACAVAAKDTYKLMNASSKSTDLRNFSRSIKHTFRDIHNRIANKYAAILNNSTMDQQQRLVQLAIFEDYFYTRDEWSRVKENTNFDWSFSSAAERDINIVNRYLSYLYPQFAYRYNSVDVAQEYSSDTTPDGIDNGFDNGFFFWEGYKFFENLKKEGARLANFEELANLLAFSNILPNLILRTLSDTFEGELTDEELENLTQDMAREVVRPFTEALEQTETDIERNPQEAINLVEEQAVGPPE